MKSGTGGGRFRRRDLLQLGAGGAGALGSAALGAAALPLLGVTPGGLGQSARAQTTDQPMDEGTHDLLHAGNPSIAVGEVDIERLGFDPTLIATDFDYGDASTRQDGTIVREFNLTAFDRRSRSRRASSSPPGPTTGGCPARPALQRGRPVRVHFVNAGSHPHTIHFHGIHSALMDGVTGIGRGQIEPGEEFTYEFDAKPFGCHLYHCHAAPLKRHIHKGLYGAFIVNPDPAKHGEAARARHADPATPETQWQEFVMVMNAFDTNFDAENEVYAVNTVAFHYMKHPLRHRRDAAGPHLPGQHDRVRPDQLVPSARQLLQLLRHGHDAGADLRTVDTIMQCQAQRGILEFSFKDHEPGIYMFHAHQSEFAELGWMSAFDVR